MTHTTPTTRAALVIGAAVALVAGLAATPAAAHAAGPTPTPTSSAAPRTTATTTPQTIRTASSATLYKGGLFVDANGEAARAAATLSSQGRTAEASAARTIAQQSVATWLGGWFTDAQLVQKIDATVAAAEKKGTTPVFVTYNIPNRDCGSHSAGGCRRQRGLPPLEPARHPAPRRPPRRRDRRTRRSRPDQQLPDADERTRGDHRRGRGDARGRRGAGLHRRRQLQLGAAADHGRTPQGRGRGPGPGLRDQRLELLPGRVRAGVRREGVAGYRRRALRDRHVAQRSRLEGHVVQRPRRRPGSVPPVPTGSTKLDALLWIKTPGASDGRATRGPRPASGSRRTPCSSSPTARSAESRGRSRTACVDSPSARTPNGARLPARSTSSLGSERADSAFDDREDPA